MPPGGGNRRFRPGLWPTVALIILAPAFVMLGNWQLDRAAFKRERLAAFEGGSNAAASVATLIRQNMSAAQGIGLRHVTGRGRYDSARQVLVEGMIQGGRAGYHVLTPLRLEDANELVMINRGWIERDFASAALPTLGPLDEGTREVQGILRSLPEPGMRLGKASAPDGATRFPVAMVYPTAAQLSALLGEPVYDGMVLLAPDARDGFVREWTPRVDGPQKHMGYAIQWYAFAATLLVLYIALNFRRDEAPGAVATRQENAL